MGFYYGIFTNPGAFTILGDLFISLVDVLWNKSLSCAKFFEANTILIMRTSNTLVTPLSLKRVKGAGHFLA